MFTEHYDTSHFPWMTAGLKKSSQHKNDLYKMYLLGSVIFVLYKLLRNKFHDLVHMAKTKAIKVLLSSIKRILKLNLITF